jgi:hypothetical protein
LSRAGPPLFITGYKRSGTTLLGTIVDRHPEIAIFMESGFMPRFYYAQVAFWPLTRESNRVRLAKAIATHPRSIVNGMEVDEAAVARAAEPRLASVLDGVMCRWALGRGASRWGDKHPGYLSKLPVLKRMFPDARFVHIYRDGRDVLLSVRRLMRWRPWDGNAARVARDWERTLARARRWGQGNPDAYLEVRYEELIRDPGPVVRRVAEFAGLDFDPVMLETTDEAALNPALATWEEVNTTINAQNVAKWTTKMDPGDLATFEYLAGERLREFGYPLSEHTLDGAGRRQARWDVLSGRLSRPGEFVQRGAKFAWAAARRGRDAG